MIATSDDIEAFVPRRGLRSAHLQTLAGALFPPRTRLPQPERRLVRVADGVQVLALCNWQPDRASSLTAIIVHGLEGSSESAYVIGTANKAWAAGMNVVRMNVRNCGGTERLGPTLYHSGLSADVGEVARELISSEHLGRIALVGFSMGGNQVLKLAGEWGSDAPAQLRAVAAISPGIDLAASADAIHRSSNRLYEWNFLRTLRRSVRRKARVFPGQFDVPGLRRLRSLRGFDDAVTAKHWGFAGADDYYARASASPLLDRIEVPTLVIHSTDDPFVIITPATRERLLRNPKIRYVETSRGGHCAFLAGGREYDGRWAERQVVRFFSGVG
ncbi:MAG: alpha/beta fold hydrolase [Acidobacteria bacterium]|nr:alpha/beta fold hydrolase [Acidobacteriota bacterium]